MTAIRKMLIGLYMSFWFLNSFLKKGLCYQRCLEFWSKNCIIKQQINLFRKLLLLFFEISTGISLSGTTLFTQALNFLRSVFLLTLVSKKFVFLKWRYAGVTPIFCPPIFRIARKFAISNITCGNYKNVENTWEKNNWSVCYFGFFKGSFCHFRLM